VLLLCPVDGGGTGAGEDGLGSSCPKSAHVTQNECAVGEDRCKLKAREGIAAFPGLHHFPGDLPMRTTQLVPALAALALLTACSDPLHPAMGRQIAPNGVRPAIGTYVGSGTRADTASVSTAQEPGEENRGSGYIGDGN
jgi:hypothetical protein